MGQRHHEVANLARPTSHRRKIFFYQFTCAQKQGTQLRPHKLVPIFDHSWSLLSRGGSIETLRRLFFPFRAPHTTHPLHHFPPHLLTPANLSQLLLSPAN